MSFAERLVEREEWGAFDPARKPVSVHPKWQKGMVVHHNGPPMAIDSHNSCTAKVRAIQRYHASRFRNGDTAYSFMVCPHGYIYECRGWYWNQFANGRDQVGEDDGRETEWMTAMVMTGTFPDGREQVVPQEVYRALVDLRHEFISLGGGLQVMPHGTGPDGVAGPSGAFRYKNCPGDQLIAWVELNDGNAVAEAEDPMILPVELEGHSGRWALVNGIWWNIDANKWLVKAKYVDDVPAVAVVPKDAVDLSNNFNDVRTIPESTAALVTAKIGDVAIDAKRVATEIWKHMKAAVCE